jgi:hypothetical protein
MTMFFAKREIPSDATAWEAENATQSHVTIREEELGKHIRRSSKQFCKKTGGKKIGLGERALRRRRPSGDPAPAPLRTTSRASCTPAPQPQAWQ